MIHQINQDAIQFAYSSSLFTWKGDTGPIVGSCNLSTLITNAKQSQVFYHPLKGDSHQEGFLIKSSRTTSIVPFVFFGSNYMKDKEWQLVDYPSYALKIVIFNDSDFIKRYNEF